MRRGGVKSFVDDLVLGRGVVISRAATSLRTVETQPWTRRFVRNLDERPISGLVLGGRGGPRGLLAVSLREKKILPSVGARRRRAASFAGSNPAPGFLKNIFR